jgi:hypothetical protein
MKSSDWQKGPVPPEMEGKSVLVYAPEVRGKYIAIDAFQSCWSNAAKCWWMEIVPPGDEKEKKEEVTNNTFTIMGDRYHVLSEAEWQYTSEHARRNHAECMAEASALRGEVDSWKKRAMLADERLEEVDSKLAKTLDERDVERKHRRANLVEIDELKRQLANSTNEYNLQLQLTVARLTKKLTEINSIVTSD